VVRVDRAGFGVMLPTFDPFRTGPPPLARGAALAEDLGFDAGWVGDHLAFHPPVMDALGALCAAAASTRTLLLGTGVLLLPMRHPVWTAKQVATVDALAPGRVLLGVGVGGENPAEWEAAGVPVRERGRRLDARAWLCIRGWIQPVVKVNVHDPSDPVPYWLISTRNPNELVAALEKANHELAS